LFKPEDLFKNAILFLLLVLLPIASSLFTVTEVLDGLSATSREEILEKLTNRCGVIGARVHTEAFFKPIFNIMVRRFFEYGENDGEKLSKLGREYNKQAGVTIESFAFNSKSELIKSDFSSPELCDVIIFFWEEINGLDHTRFYDQVKPAMQKYFGRDFHPRKIKKLRNRIFTFVAGNQPGMIFYSLKREADREGFRGLFLIVRNLPNHIDILNKSMASTEFKDTGLAMISNGTDKQIISSNLDAKKVREIELEMMKDNINVIEKYGQIWKLTNFSDFSIMAAGSFDKNIFEILRKIAILISVFFTVLGGAVIIRSRISSARIRISIRLKLIAVFLFAVYLPLIGLFHLSFKGLQNRRQVLENEARKAMLDTLYQIDSDFMAKEAEIKAIFDRVFHDRTWQSRLSKDWAENDCMMRTVAGVNVEGESFFNWLEIRNTDLEQIFCTARGEANNRIKDLNRVMAQISLEKFAPENVSQVGKKMRQSDFLIRSIMENPVLGFSHYFESPGELVEMEFEGAFLYWYWNYYKNPVGNVVFFSSNTKAQFNAVNYLEKKLLERFHFGNSQLELVSYHPSEQKWVPSGKDIHSAIEMLIRIGIINQRITSTKIEIDGQVYLATCFPGIKIRDVFIACLYPIAEINSRIDLMRHQIYFGMFLILLVAVLTGLLLTRTFLQPVGELNTGLNALRKRETEFRVNIGNNDEFGSLGETFNQMMVEVSEMLLAGAVQQCLIPTDPPQFEGYELILHNQMATDVGGDYADAFALPDNRFLLVMGDVTGHGVSSSILTAMVKALIFRFSQRHQDLSLIMRDLSHMIFDLLHHRKLMTFCAIIIEQNTGNYMLANAGHPFPMICNPNGSSRTIEHNSLPLGVSKKRSSYSTTSGTIEPGEVLILYTDGIAEATNSKGQMFGFDRVRNIVGENCHQSGKAIKEELLNQFWSHYTEKHLDDDLTFIILKRLSDHALEQ